MKKRIANAVELLLLITTYIILSVKTFGINTGAKVSAIECMQIFYIQFIPMCAIYITCAVMCIVSIISKNKYKDGKIHSILAVILFISVNWNFITIPVPTGDRFTSNNFPVAIFELILFLVVVVAFVKRSPLIAPIIKDLPSNNEEQPIIIKGIQETSNADELKKYKDLLDSGIITQEEFDEKKKQLLGL